MLKGIAASPGIEIGKVYRYEEATVDIHESTLQKEDIQSQIDVLNLALIQTKHQLSDLIALCREKLGEEKAEIFEAHLMILEDEEFINDIRNNISSQFLYADAALQETLNKYINRK